MNWRDIFKTVKCFGMLLESFYVVLKSCLAPSFSQLWNLFEMLFQVGLENFGSGPTWCPQGDKRKEGASHQPREDNTSQDDIIWDTTNFSAVPTARTSQLVIFSHRERAVVRSDWAQQTLDGTLEKWFDLTENRVVVRTTWGQQALDDHSSSFVWTALRWS